MKTLKTLVSSMVFMVSLSGLSPVNAVTISPAGAFFNSHATMRLESPASFGIPIKCSVIVAGMVAADGQSVMINQATIVAGGDQLCSATTAQNLPWMMKNFSIQPGSNASGLIQGVNFKSVSTACAPASVNITISWSGLYSQFNVPSTQPVGNCKLREFSFQPSPTFTFTP